LDNLELVVQAVFVFGKANFDCLGLIRPKEREAVLDSIHLSLECGGVLALVSGVQALALDFATLSTNGLLALYRLLETLIVGFPGELGPIAVGGELGADFSIVGDGDLHILDVDVHFD
jgi:hypothetical protein